MPNGSSRSSAAIRSSSKSRMPGVAILRGTTRYPCPTCTTSAFCSKIWLTTFLMNIRRAGNALANTFSPSWRRCIKNIPWSSSRRARRTDSALTIMLRRRMPYCCHRNGSSSSENFHNFRVGIRVPLRFHCLIYFRIPWPYAVSFEGKEQGRHFHQIT